MSTPASTSPLTPPVELPPAPPAPPLALVVPPAPPSPVVMMFITPPVLPSLLRWLACEPP
jgi:hypothetical protein